MDGLDLSVREGSHRLQGLSSRLKRSTPKRKLTRFLPFLLLVVAPTVAAATYLYGYAADQYVSEARFVVRGPSQQSPGVLSGILQSAGIGRAEDDTYAVQDYMLSRDALTELVQQEGIREIFKRPEADRVFRFPGLLGEDTFEHLYMYYLKHVDVQMDSTTSVSELTVKAFRPDDAQRVARALLGAGERLVNRMNARQHDNGVVDARKEVQLAEARVQDVSSRLADFRNRESLLDPTKQSVPLLQAIDTLRTKLGSTKLEISQLQAGSPNSPLLANARQRATALQAQIDEARSKVTGTDSSLVPKIREFDMLSLEREFADKQLASVTTSLESARISASRQQLYLEAVVQPNAPDYALFPRRAANLAVVFSTLFGIYVMGALLLAGAREHRMV